MHFTTARLEIRRFRPEDAAALAGYRSDPRVARYQGWQAPVTVPQARGLVREFAAGDPLAPGWFQYAVELRGPGLLIGDIGVNLNENRMQAELGFTLAAAHQGRGYAAEAVGRVLEHLFADRDLHRVAAECDARNTKSAALLERLGFRREGHLLAATWIKGEWTDDLLYGLLAREWRHARAGQG